MKNILITLSLVLISLSINAQTKTETIKVFGNCSQCKSHIQKAAKAAGAEEAKWNVDTKILTVIYDTKKTNSKKIQSSIASVGYDTQDATALDAAYKKLDDCCQYDRKNSK